jgi:MoaA/NifB/PqqE/SkfB family radical SAM enzyme
MSLIEKSIPSISIETTNICNANCVFCAYQFQKRPKGVMSMQLFEKVVNEYAEIGGGKVNLTPTVGEPLADQHIIERIRFARANKAVTQIGMYSNMIALERLGAEALVSSGLSSLVVSTSGLNEDMYGRVFRSKEYRRMLRNLMAFVDANNRAGRPVDLFVDMRADRPAQEVFSYPDYKRLADLIGPERIGLKFRYDNWAGKITQQQLLGNMKLRSPVNLLRPRIAPCSELYSGPMVYWDGSVGACGCRDVDAQELIIGNANESHIADIWFGDEIKALRSEFMTPRIRDICKTCTHYNPASIYFRRDQQSEVRKLQPVVWKGRS